MLELLVEFALSKIYIKINKKIKLENVLWTLVVYKIVCAYPSNRITQW